MEIPSSLSCTQNIQVNKLTRKITQSMIRTTFLVLARLLLVRGDVYGSGSKSLSRNTYVHNILHIHNYEQIKSSPFVVFLTQTT